MKTPLAVKYLLKGLAILLFGLGASIGIVVGVTAELGTLFTRKLKALVKRESVTEPVTMQPQTVTVSN